MSAVTPEKIYVELSRCVIEMDIEGAKKATKEAFKAGISAHDAVIKGLVPGMKAVSEKYEKKEYFLPQVLACAVAFYESFDILKPEIVKTGAVVGKGNVVIGVVEGDIHDIGKNLVKTMLEASGYACSDLGRDVLCEDFVDKASEIKAHIVAMSTLMTPTLESMRRVIDLLKEAGIRDRLKVMIGGGSPSPEFAKEIGADEYGESEADAMKLADKYIEELKK